MVSLLSATNYYRPPTEMSTRCPTDLAGKGVPVVQNFATGCPTDLAGGSKIFFFWCHFQGFRTWPGGGRVRYTSCGHAGGLSCYMNLAECKPGKYQSTYIYFPEIKQNINHIVPLQWWVCCTLSEFDGKHCQLWNWEKWYIPRLTVN